VRLADSVGVAFDGISGTLSNTANSLLSRLKIALAVVLGRVGTATGGIAQLLGGRLGVIWLGRADNLVSGARDILRCLVEG